MSRKRRDKAQRKARDGAAEPTLSLAAAGAGSGHAAEKQPVGDPDVDADNGAGSDADSRPLPDPAPANERDDLDGDDPLAERERDADAPADCEADSEPDAELDSDPAAGAETEQEEEEEEEGDGEEESDQEPLSAVSRLLHPQHPFLKGAVFGLLILIPLTALTVYVLGKLGIGDGQASYYSVIAFVAVFAGVPAIVSAGGIGRAAASALVREGERGGPVMSLRVAALQTAIAEIGLVLLSVVPLGEIPTQPGHWASIITLSGVAGALGGCALGLWIVAYGSRQP